MKKETFSPKKIIETISPVIESVAARLKLIPLEIAFVKEGGRWFLRIFIYSTDHSISHKDCEDLTRGLDEYLDELIPVNYYLEVSSPGAERKLKSVPEYKIFAGKNVKIKLKQSMDDTDTKEIKATIIDYTEQTGLKIYWTDQDCELDIPVSNISSVRLCLN